MRKKILIISSSFYPINSPRSFRTTELVKEFSRLEHDVTLLTPKNEIHFQFESTYNVTIKDLGKKTFPSIKISSTHKYIKLLQRGLKRILNLLFDYPDVELMFMVKNKLKKEFGYDLMISIAVPFPMHWGVAWARKKNNPIARVWVADCGDPYYFNTHDSFRKLFYFKYFEKWFSRKANFITIPFEGLKNYFFNEFEEKYKIIPQGFNFDEIELSTELLNNNIIKFAYSGVFIPKSRDPSKFLDFLLKVDIPFEFVIYTRHKEFLSPYIPLLGDKLVIKDYIPRKNLLYELSKMDFLVNFEYNPTNQAPSKLIDYSLTKRPILLIQNKKFHKNIILEFLNKNYSNQFKYGDIERFNIKNVTTQFLELIE